MAPLRVGGRESSRFKASYKLGSLQWAKPGGSGWPATSSILLVSRDFSFGMMLKTNFLLSLSKGSTQHVCSIAFSTNYNALLWHSLKCFNTDSPPRQSLIGASHSGLFLIIHLIIEVSCLSSLAKSQIAGQTAEWLCWAAILTNYVNNGWRLHSNASNANIFLIKE